MPRINTDSLTRSIGTLELALECLREQKPDEIMLNVYRGACRYESQVVLGLTSSLLRRRLRPYFAAVSQVDEMIPGRVFREAARLHLISVDECSRWLNYGDHQNRIAHRYGREFAEQAITVLSPLIKDARRIAEVIGAETDD